MAARMAARDLNDLYFFVQVVHQGGFAAASRALDVPKSTLSRRIQELEARLGARLLQRTSRRFVVTDVGREFLRHAEVMLSAADAAEDSVKRRLAEPSGVVRFTVPVGIASILAPLLPRFLDDHPKVELEQHVSNRIVDLVQEGFDLALRGHLEPLTDSGLIERRLVAAPWVLAASPAYVARAGLAQKPSDLESHAALVLGAPGTSGSADRWILRSADRDSGIVVEETVPVRARLRSDEVQTLKAAAIGGAGVAALPEYLCSGDIERGALVRVLPAWTAGDGAITMLVPSRRGQLPSVREFMNFLIDEFPRAAAAEAGCVAPVPARRVSYGIPADPR